MNKKAAEQLASVPFRVTASLASELHRLDNVYCSFRNTPNWKQLFSLQYYHASLILYSEFVVAYEEWYTKMKQPHFDPRRSDFKPGHLREITKQSCRIRDIKKAGERLVEAVEYLVELTTETATSQLPLPGLSSIPSTSGPIKFTELKLEIRGLCIEIKGCLSRLSSGLEHDIKFLGLRREMRQTNSVQRLTILATIFLPLSLSAGVLSMQTRFKDLGPLLYDFFGVVVLLGALVFPLLIFLSVLKIATDHVLVDLDREMGPKYKSVRHFLSVSIWFGTTTLGILVLVSFILGMFRDVVLGAKILGYGLAVFSSPMLLMISLVWVVVFLRWLWNVRKSRRQSERQTETRGEGRDEEAARPPTAVAETTTPMELTDTSGTGHQAANASTSQAVSS